MSRALRTTLGLLGCLWAAAVVAGRNPPLPTSELLVDLARDWGLRQRGQQSPADAEHVRALLEAAVRLDARRADAWAWLYELSSGAGDRAAAARALSGLVAADPTNETAFVLWLQAGLRGLQTGEDRAAWLEAALRADRAAPLQAAAHVELARLALERLDRDGAQEHVGAALALEPASMDAAVLAWQALTPADPAPERLAAALRVLSVQPLAIEAAWAVASELDDAGLFADANRFYEHAQDAQQRVLGGGLPGALLLDWARNRAAAGELARADALVREAITADPTRTAEAAFFLHYLLTEQGQAAAASELEQQLAKRFAALVEPRDWPVNEVAQGAWYYVTMLQNPHRALALAENAAVRAPDDPFVQRVLGWAHAVNQHPDEARRTLAPLAEEDPYAAYMLARLRQEAGDSAGVEEALASLRNWPHTGPALHLLAAIRSHAAAQPDSAPAIAPVTRAAAPGATVATQPAPSAARTPPPAVVAEEQRRQAALRPVLAGFQDDVLEFYRTPEHFLEASVTMDNPSLAAGEPWWATFALTNRGAFPITLGPDAMLNPVFLVSMTLEGDRTRSYPALLTVSLERVRVLEPGETARVRRTLDVGPVRQVARTTPQQLQRVNLQVLLAPERGADGQWRSGPGGVALRPVYFNQVPVSTGRESLAALFAAVVGESNVERVQALEVLARLLGEQQRVQLTKLNYAPAPIPAARIQAVLLDALRSPQWEIQVRALDTLQVVGLDRELTRAVEQALEHQHWLVRLMAVRVLARQGATFAERAAQIAANDPDAQVRGVAASYVQAWRAPAAAMTRPAGEPGG